MKTKIFNFKRETKSYPNFNFDKPTIIYELLDKIGHELRIEFIFSINSAIIIDDKKYICGPLKKKISFGEINILNHKEERIGYVDYCQGIFEKKKLVLFPIEQNTRTEKWLINTNTNILKENSGKNLMSILN